MPRQDQGQGPAAGSSSFAFPFRMRAVLLPAAGFVKKRVRISGEELLLGSGPRSPLRELRRDDTVAPIHARIIRNGEDFILQDERSGLGTFLSGVPVISCPLRDGDVFQIGRNVFIFGRILEVEGDR
jgi:hypothetical protein